MYENEKQVAAQAEKMLESSLRQKTLSFKDHANRNPENISLKQATAKARVKKYGSKRNQNLTYYMRSLAIRMPRHGFIQHFGVDIIRSGGARVRTKPKTTPYGFKSHAMKMPAKPFINDAVNKSNVVDFVMSNITKIRAEELFFEVKRILENK